MSNKLSIKEIFQAEFYVLKLLLKTSPKQYITYIFLMIIRFPLPLISVYLWKIIIDLLSKINTHNIDLQILFFFLITYIFINIISVISGYIIDDFLGPNIQDKITYLLDMKIMQKVSILDMSFFDEPKNKDLLETVKLSQNKIINNINFLIRTLFYIITFILGFIMFLSYNFAFAILYIFTCIPGAIIEYKNEIKMDQFSINSIPENREKNYYRFLLTDSSIAKELRLYNLAGYFKARYNDLWIKLRRLRTSIFKKGVFLVFFASFLKYIGFVIIVIISIRNVMDGKTTLGTLSLFIGLLAIIDMQFSGMLVSIPFHYKNTLPHTLKFIEFLKYESEVKNNGHEKPKHLPEIEFCNVFFKYPNTNDYVLKNLSFKIESGQKVALVGVNGAGKSTIIKLILRFYEPESGEILLDGKNIKLYPIDEIYNIFSVCFQDVNKYALTFKENIFLSNINKMEDETALLYAAKVSSADKIYENFNNGIYSDLTKKFNEEGYELSQGQWQKVAIARTFFRDARIIILDEPSSALDPEAEDFIFSSLYQLFRDRGGIIISHRLSSITMCDIIILIENGTVIETGTHSTLIENNGRYAKLYSMQSDKYLNNKDMR